MNMKQTPDGKKPANARQANLFPSIPEQEDNAPTGAIFNSLADLAGIPKHLAAKWAENPSAARAGMDEEEESGDVGGPLAKTAKGESVLYIYGPIVDDSLASMLNYFGIAAVSGAGVRKALDAFDGKELTIRINSPGGFVSEASVIHQAISELKKHGVQMKSLVDGLAASSATIVMLAAEDVRMARLASVFIHNAWDCVCGNQHELRAISDSLNRTDMQLAGIYADRMGIERDAAFALMSAPSDSPDGRGTWYSAEEAIAAGLANGMDEDEEEGKEMNAGEDGEEEDGEMKAGQANSNVLTLDLSKSSKTAATAVDKEPVAFEGQRRRAAAYAYLMKNAQVAK